MNKDYSFQDFCRDWNDYFGWFGTIVLVFAFLFCMMGIKPSCGCEDCYFARESSRIISVILSVYLLLRIEIKMIKKRK